MDGNEDAQFESLLQEARTFASQIRSSKVQPNEALYTLQSSFMKTIEYCLPVTQLSVQKWDAIMKPVMKAALPKCRYSRTITIPLRYGPFIHGGTGIHSPFYYAGILQIATLIQENVCGSQTGTLLRTSAEELRLEVGFNYTMQNLPYIEVIDYV